MSKLMKCLQIKFNEFNIRFFNEEITLPITFKIIKTNYEGCTLKTTNSIEIRIHEILLDLKFEEELDNTLVHEMIHAWQIEYNGKADHKKTFKSWCKKIKEIDKTMVISIYMDADETSKFNEEKNKTAKGYILIPKNKLDECFFYKILSKKDIKRYSECYNVYYSNYFGFTPIFSKKSEPFIDVYKIKDLPNFNINNFQKLQLLT
jgi:hypothetical protein